MCVTRGLEYIEYLETFSAMFVCVEDAFEGLLNLEMMLLMGLFNLTCTIFLFREGILLDAVLSEILVGLQRS